MRYTQSNPFKTSKKQNMELQHIIRVEVIEASAINIIDIDADIVCLLGMPQFEELNIRKPASLSISTEKRDGTLMSTATLAFHTCQSILQKNHRYAFLCTAANGTRYLLGRAERPYPVFSTSKNLAADFNSSQLTQVTVNYTCDGYIPTVADR